MFVTGARDLSHIHPLNGCVGLDMLEVFQITCNSGSDASWPFWGTGTDEFN